MIVINAFDFINGCFEAFGGLAIWGHVSQIRKDKKCYGVNKKSTGFFTSWGFYNLFYYPHLHQWFSFTGGLFIVLGNCVWLFHMWRYRHNK